ncbi:linear amide C-N hydrolase [Shewanella maritima]|uniref:Linear amide C-N hydrolase n=1 Tax=Shewanella maritima TaxID=2520507 RepID=A0A411PK11_9GAMM|nr:linear amide C-N hydrolase [Shewanella maritima]QBF83762.1 linear amide C-N hydrolase [Shewanella maritima]
MKKSIIAFAIAATVSAGFAQACTTAVYGNDQAQMTMRTMDWFGQDQAVVVGTGKGMATQYSETDGVETTSKFAALKIESFNPGVVAEAMNENGFEARILYLGKEAGTKFAADTAEKPNVDAGMVPTWAVDNFDNVADVINALQQVDVVPTGICDLPNHEGECIYPPVHYQFADASGNAAVVEFIDGEMKVYTEYGANYMSNDPAFDQHLKADAEKVEPNATINPLDRRLRAKVIVEDLYTRNVTDINKAKLSLKAVGATVFAGYDQLDKEVNDIFPTLWTNYTDRTNKTWTLDRYDSWAAEQYSFEQFDTTAAKRVVLGQNPNL